MATVVERVSVLETKVDNLGEKISNVQTDVRENHKELKTQLKTMYDASCNQHAELATKIKELEGFKNKWMYMIIGGIAVGAWVVGHFQLLDKFLK